MDDIYGELERLSARYAKLHGLFAEFYKVGTPLLMGGKLRGIEVGPLIEDRYFNVTLAGTTARFTFCFLGDEFKGRVVCERVNPPNGQESGWLESIGHIDFNGEGIVAGMNMPKGPFEGDAIRVSNDSHACYLIADLLHKAITTPPAES
ncbi:MAG: hypothetical protein ACLQBA_10905 [Candidatus Binataceae bacterium]